MPFDSSTRNKLQKMVVACRRILTDEFTAQLQSLYGIQPTGEITDVASMTHLDDEQLTSASLLRERIDHLADGQSEVKKAAAEAIDRVIREQAFTVLNRLAALRMCEECGIVQECIGNGFQSRGFQVYCTTAGSGLGDIYQRYRVFLQCLFHEISLDLGVLFDRFSPFGLLFPREPALLETLKSLDDNELKEVWKEDEAIGWIYQYFNSKEEREAMRKASAAPRNSRELAVRNQFFTPRYVVEFLTDNTLGRIWYEMTKGETQLKEQCHYLVRRPNEIFLDEGEEPPQVQEDEALEKSQEELLKEAVYIQHRPLKDPREIQMLDPACGSMHFGLYAFDLYEHIYEEAWGHYPELMSDLREVCPTREDFMKRVPGLILRHNIHGIDIDPRACQIAGLSLWLRAERSYQKLGLKPAERPRITRANVVCAEPMPGEKDFLEEFVGTFRGEQRIVGELVREVWEIMQLAGEAGSLLKIEVELREAIDRVRKEWEDIHRGQSVGQLPMWPDRQPPRQLELRMALGEIKKEAFWDQAEGWVLKSLKRFSEKASNGKGYQRKLFAEDTEQGFAFIDLCRKKYDVVLMNPPFGDASTPSKKYLEELYGDTKGDVYKSFVECFHARLFPAAFLGIISSRTGFFLGQSEDWRTRVVLRLFRPIILADLGSGVLDAMVEVAAYVVRNLSESEARNLTLSLVPVLEKVVRDRRDNFSLPKWQAARNGLKRHQAVAELELLAVADLIQRCPGNIVRYAPLWQAVEAVTSSPDPVFPPLVCFRALAENDKGTALAKCILDLTDHRVFWVNPREFENVPSTPFAYWVSNRVRNLFNTLPKAGADDRRIALGLSTKNDFRFVRVWWEVDSRAVGRDKTWANYANGGSFSPFYFTYPAVLLAERHCTQLRAYLIAKFPYLGGNAGWILHDENDYRSPAIAWPLRTHAFSPAFLPAHFFFSARTYAALMPPELLPTFVGLFASKAVDLLLKVSLGRAGYPEFVTSVVRALPIPVDVVEQHILAELAKRAWHSKRQIASTELTSHAFTLPMLLTVPDRTIAGRAVTCAIRVQRIEETVTTIQSEIDNLAFRLYDFDEADRAAVMATLPTEPSKEDEVAEATSADASTLAAELMDYVLGTTLGRWDLRLALDPSLAPQSPDPFASLPVCSPGMLLGSDGLPARTDSIVSEEWLRARPDAGTLPAERSVARPTTSDSEYPLRITWSGILVDDSDGDETQAHPEDIVHRTREVLDLLWGDRAQGIEQEACEILGVVSLRDYFRKPSGFFDDHLKRYSKSRRKAPIYWPLSTESGSYTLWIYYHRLTDQTLYQCVNDFVDPKLETVAQDVDKLRGQVLQGGTAKQREQLERLQKLQQELMDFRAELLRVAALPYRPNLNDGVLITASPLYKLFRLPRWRKDLQECWKKLESGEYDWAHLAYSIWPDRVREKCRKDKSIAIAHGLEELYEEIAAPKKAKRGKKSL